MFSFLVLNVTLFTIVVKTFFFGSFFVSIILDRLKNRAII